MFCRRQSIPSPRWGQCHSQGSETWRRQGTRCTARRPPAARLLQDLDMSPVLPYQQWQASPLGFHSPDKVHGVQQSSSGVGPTRHSRCSQATMELLFFASVGDPERCRVICDTWDISVADRTCCDYDRRTPL